MEIEKKIDEILSRGVGEFIDPDGSFRKKLIAKKKGKYDKDIIIKYGVDPTRPDIHLGHAVCFRKLRQLQDLGCKVIFLVGDFTASIGDPTGRSKVRPSLSAAEIKSNAETYISQLKGMIDLNSNKFDWIPNSDWYFSISDALYEESFIDRFNDSLGFGTELREWTGEKVKNGIITGNDQLQLVRAYAWKKTRKQSMNHPERRVYTVTLMRLLRVLGSVPLSRVIERDMFQNRIASGEPLYMHELLYPILQGLDSSVLGKIYGSCDLEVGGTDQLFNMLVGRDLVEAAEFYNREEEKEYQEAQAVFGIKILEGTDGKEKMSKSLDNYIGITEEPNSMFGKVMSIPDTSIINYLELATEVPMEEIQSIKEAMDSGSMNPRDAKVRLAKEIVALYHCADEAAKAEEYFVNTFSKGEIPEDIAEAKVEAGMKLVDLIVSLGFAGSKGDARRKIEQGGVELGGEKITDPNFFFAVSHSGKVLKVGKKDFVKISL